MPKPLLLDDLPTLKTQCPPERRRTRLRFEDLAPRQVLALAIDVEQGNAARFDQLANLWAPDGGLLRLLLHRCRDDELAHAGALERAWAARFGDLTLPIVRRPDVDGVAEVFQLADFDCTKLRVDQVLDRLRRAEEAAARFYDRAASTASDAGLRRLYEALAIWEREHADGVEDLRKLAEQAERSVRRPGCA